MRSPRLLLGALTVALLSCSDSTGSSNSDIPADGYKPVPAPASGPLRPAVALDPADVTRSGRVKVSIGGLLDPATNAPITYEVENLTLVEDGVVKGFKIIRAGEGVSFRADIALLIDNTGSMAPAIAGIRASVLQFVDSLRNGGFDVTVGAIAFNDGYAKSNNAAHTVGLHNNITNAVDTVGSAGVYGWINLTKQLGTADPLYDFINTLPATGGGDAPELALNALDFARRKLAWRPGAQRIYIVISDITTWGKDAPGGVQQKGIGPSFPWTDVTMANALKADGAVLHCLCPSGTGNLGTGIYHLRPLAELTGGVWINFGLGNYSLNSLPIIGITRSSIVAEFVRGGSSRRSRTLRVVVELLNPDGSRRSDGETVYIIEY